MPVPNNPATRLAIVLENLRRQRATGPVKASFMNVLDCHEDGEFFRAFGQLLELPAQIDTAVRRYADPEHDDLDLLLRWRGPIENALLTACALTSATNTVLAAYSDDDVRSLKHCGSLLSRSAAELRIDEESLYNLRDRVDQLHDEVVAAANIPVDLRSFILDQLHRIRRALSEFQLRGPAALAEATELVAGAVISHRHLISDDNQESQTFIQKLISIVDFGERLGNAAQSLGKGGAAMGTGATALWIAAHGIATGELPAPPIDPPAAVQMDTGANPPPGTLNGR